MAIQIVDCTIRDGGYLLDKNSEPEFVKGIMSGLSKAGIDFIETGFLQSKVNGESIVYKNPKDIEKYLPKDEWNRTNFLGFCDNSRYSIDDLDEYDGKSFKWLRISFAKHELDSALNFCDNAQKKGYIVQFNPMDTIDYSTAELDDLIQKTNKIKPGALSIVDTFGVMRLSDLINIFNYIDSKLDVNIKIGLHAHDNLRLACALAEQIIILAQHSKRDVIVDGSLLGMGRGAGNASTECLAELINKNYLGNYNIPTLIETIEKYIKPLKEKILWGYDLEMFICGASHAHVDNIAYLKNTQKFSTGQMYDIINSMPPQSRIRYGKNYSKTDFTELQKACSSFLES